MNAWKYVVGMAAGFAVLAILCARPAQANVTLRNGNFIMGYTDAIYPGGSELKIERTYNSKSPFKGMFGWGWGSPYEAYLSVDPDGAVTLHEWGGGVENRFLAGAVDQELLDRSLDALVSAAVRSGKVKQKDAAEYRKKLGADQVFRTEEWDEYVAKGLVERADLPVGTVLISDRLGRQQLKRTRDGYVRATGIGESETYNARGRLVRTEDRNGNFVEIVYDAKGCPVSIADSAERHFRVACNTRGLVEKVTDDRGREASYEYNRRDQLVRAKDVDGHIFRYEYDKRHNMTAIRYEDGTSMEMRYYGEELSENIRSVKDQAGMLTTYDYFTDPADKLHYGVRVTLKDPTGSVELKKGYEWFERIAADGSVWLSKTTEESDGERGVVEYNENGSPLSISRGGESASFRYDEKNRMTRKETTTEVREMRYQEPSGKVEYVKVVRKGDPPRAQESWFSYDDRGNLVQARDSNNIKLKLSYDDNGRVSDIISGAQHVRFAYNKHSKPREIEVVGVGTVTVVYNEDGEVEKVDSDKGRKVALEVVTVMQALLDVIRPADVSIGL